MDVIEVNQTQYRVIRLLGHGKGGYSYLVKSEGKEYVLKQIHHEPCDYYSFGNKIEAEINDYNILKQTGIRLVTFEERQLMAIYNTGTRKGLLEELMEMQSYISAEEKDLNKLTASAIRKLQEMSDDDYAALDLVPEFISDEE